MEFEFSWELNLIPGLNFAIGFNPVHTDMHILKNFTNMIKIIYMKFKNFEVEKKSIKNMRE